MNVRFRLSIAVLVSLLAHVIVLVWVMQLVRGSSHYVDLDHCGFFFRNISKSNAAN